MAILGTSVGWQAMIISLMFGIRVHGYESVLSRYNAAVELATQNRVNVKRLSVHLMSNVLQVHDVQFRYDNTRTATLDWTAMDILYFTGHYWNDTESALY